LLGAAVLLQAQAGMALLPADLLSADPPAHYTTGVMLHDYLLHAGQPALPFAECFYIRYPKVAFGHWPPLLYILEADWFFLFGTKIAAARWLCALLAAGCAAAVWWRCRKDFGRRHAVASAALFLALPVVRHQAWNIMSDLLLTGLTFLALCSLSDYLARRKRKDAVWLVVWSSLAILTKGTGWLLLGPMVAGPLLCGRPRIYLRGSYWLAVISTLVISAPFYLWVSRLNLSYPISGQIQRVTGMFSQLSPQMWMAVGSGAMIGLCAAYWLLPRRPVRPVRTRILVLALWGVTLAVFINVAPVTPELSRYYMVLLAPAAYFFCAGMAACEQRISARWVTLLVYAGLMAACVPVRFVSTSAFRQAMGSIPSTPGGSVILVESDAGGEGALVAARLEQDGRRADYVLRGSHLLASSTWSGYEYKLNYETADAVRAAVDTAGPEYIVLDMSAPPSPDSRLLAGVVQQAEQWQLTMRVPVPVSSRRGDLLVYRRRVPPVHAVPAVQLGPETGSRTVTCQASR
jgi:hypothetical protein